MKEIISNTFKEIFLAEPALVVCSPGRINIIGEHTDYNEGFVLPASINKAIYVAIGQRNDDEVHLYATEFKEHFSIALHNIHKTENAWANYILGVISEIQKVTDKLKGFNLVLTGDLPIGAGMSSSAAVECAGLFALNELFGLGLHKLQMVNMAQQAEHNFAGVMCGIMDMFASVMGKKDHAIKLDCKTLEYKYVPFVLEGYSVVLFNTNVKHSLASSAYNTRRQECAKGVSLIQQRYAQVTSLRYATKAMLDECVLPIDKVVDTRCRFVVKEIARLQAACVDLSSNNLKAMGAKMFETHDGLSKEYEVSCKELDFLVDQVRNNEFVIGSRMMGGGFGGCTINIIKNEAVDTTIKTVGESYEQHMKLPFTPYIMHIENGTRII
jgi:galactokinase